MAIFPAHRATAIWLVPASGLYYWLWGPFAIQGSLAFAYISNNRDITGPAFGEGGALGIFTIAPTIKPRGGFFTRPELRAFATFAVWSDELKGAIGATPYANQNYGLSLVSKLRHFSKRVTQHRS